MKSILLQLFLLLSLFSFSQNNNKAKAVTCKIFFQGNSLLDAAINHVGANNQKYVTYTLYNNNIKGSYSNVSLVDYSISGQDQIQINALMVSQFGNGQVTGNDLIIIMEGVNNLSHYPSKTGADAFLELQIFVNYISQFTDKYVVVTTAACNFGSNPVDLFNRIQDYNTLIRANYSGNHLFDLASNPNFSTMAAASNTIYYDPDKLHWVQGGQDLFISLCTTAITNILNQ